MPELYLVTEGAMPETVYGSYSRFSLEKLSKPQLLKIEDRLYKDGYSITIPVNSSLVVVPDVNEPSIEATIVSTEFALALLTVSGHPSFRFVSAFSGSRCIRAQILPERFFPAPVFLDTAGGNAAAQWLSRCMLSRANLKDRFHITALRYLRFATSKNDADKLLDLCICLESLLDSQTEVSFRFGVSLAKVCIQSGAEAMEMANLLSELYDIRSKLAHGDPAAAKLIKKLEPKLPRLRHLANRILIIYVLYTSKHTRAEWKEHLRKSLFT
jgi:hypothetical protein